MTGRVAWPPVAGGGVGTPGWGIQCQLKRKRCACGKQVTARQLQQYECCADCYRTKTKKGA